MPAPGGLDVRGHRAVNGLAFVAGNRGDVIGIRVHHADPRSDAPRPDRRARQQPHRELVGPVRDPRPAPGAALGDRRLHRVEVAPRPPVLRRVVLPHQERIQRARRGQVDEGQEHGQIAGAPRADVGEHRGRDPPPRGLRELPRLGIPRARGAVVVEAVRKDLGAVSLPVLRLLGAVGGGGQPQIARREVQAAVGRPRPGLPPPADESEAPVQGLPADARRHQPAVDQHLRRRDQHVGAGPVLLDPRPERFDVRGTLEPAESVARGRRHLEPRRRREREERVAGHRPVVERHKRDPHLTAPSMMPRRKYRCRHRKTTITGTVMSTAPAAMYRVFVAKSPDRYKSPTASG